MTEEEWEMYDEPCLECGGTEFLQTEYQSLVVHCDENGQPESFEPQGEYLGQGSLDILEIACRGCDTVLYEAED